MEELWGARDESGDVSFALDDGSVYLAHRCVLLLGRVEWFSTCLRSSFVEGQAATGVVGSAPIRIRDMDMAMFGVALRWAYSLKLGVVSAESLFAAAHFFSIPAMLDTCFELYGYVSVITLMHRYEPSYNKQAKAYGRLTEESFGELPFDVRQWYAMHIRMEVGYVAAHLMSAHREQLFVENAWTIGALQRCDTIGASTRTSVITHHFISRVVHMGIWDAREVCKLLYYQDRATIVQLYPMRVGYTTPHNGNLPGHAIALGFGEWKRVSHLVLKSGPAATPVYIGADVASYSKLRDYIIYDCWYNEG